MNVELSFISLAVLMGLLAMRVPIGLALIGVAVGGLYLLRGVNPAFSAAKVTPFEFVAHWTLSAIPMFILMGAIASNAGMIASIYAAARIWLRRLPGGLAIATSFAGAGFAAMSGSSLATTALAKLACNEAGFLAANEAVQVLGGLGFSLESTAQYCLRRTRGWMIAGGSTEILKNRVAEGVFDRRFDQRPPRTMAAE